MENGLAQDIQPGENDDELPGNRVPFVARMLALFFAGGVVIVACLLMQHFWVAKDYDPLIRETLVPEFQHECRPEPLERAKFMLTLLLFPIVFGGSYMLLNRLIKKRAFNPNTLEFLYRGMYLAILLTAAYMLRLVILDPAGSTRLVSWLVKAVDTSFLTFWLAVFLTWVVYVSPVDLLRNRWVNVVACMMIAVLFGAIGLHYIYSDARVFADPDVGVSYHLMAIFTANADVAMGKTLLVNSTHQYGLYPHFLSPIFALTGFSMLRFTAVMTLLLGGSLIILYQFIRGILNSRTIALLTFVFVLIPFFFLLPECYLQYFPVRSLFPFILCLLMLRFITTRSSKIYYGTMLFCGASILWNLDTGAVVMGSWLLTLSYLELCGIKEEPRQVIISICKHWLKGIAALIGCIVLYTLFAYLRTGELIRLERAYELQRLFYGIGFFMLPMSLVGLWNVLALIYGLGLAYSIGAVLDRKSGSRPAIVFFLSVLGCGIASYYQGRSHPQVLIVVLYPAIILLGLFLDHSLTLRSRALFSRVPAAGLLFVFCLAFINIFQTAWEYSASSREWFASSEKDLPATWPLRHLEGSPREEPAYISGFYRGIIMHRLNKPTPVDVMSEILLNRHERTLIEWIGTRPKRAFVLTERNAISARVYAAMFQSNWIWEKSSPDGRYQVFRVAEFALDKRPNSVFHQSLEKNLQQEIAGAVYVPIELEPAFSVEVVVKPDAVQPKFATIVSSHISGSGITLEQTGNDNEFHFGYGNGKGYSMSTPFTLSPEKWSYVTATVDAHAIKIYINSELIVTTPVTAPFANSKKPLRVGGWFAEGRDFKGPILETRLTNGAMTLEQVKENWAHLLQKLPK